MTTPILGAPVWTESQALPATKGNEIVSWLEFFAAGGNIIDRDLLDPTALTPSNGQAYLIDGTGAGAWAGEDDKIALRVNGGWVYITPKEGMRLWVADEATDIRYTGTFGVDGVWEDVAAGGGGGGSFSGSKVKNASNLTNQNHTSNIPIGWDTNLYDVGSYRTGSSNRFIVPSAGYYLLAATVGLGANTSGNWGRIYIQHWDYLDADAGIVAAQHVELTATDGPDINISGVVYCAQAGDYFQCILRSESDSTLTIYAYSTFSITKLG